MNSLKAVKTCSPKHQLRKRGRCDGAALCTNASTMQAWKMRQSPKQKWTWQKPHPFARVSKRNTWICLLVEPMFVLVCLASLPGTPRRALDAAGILEEKRAIFYKSQPYVCMACARIYFFFLNLSETFWILLFFWSVGSIQTASYVEIRIPAVRNQTCSERSAYSTTTAHERADFNSRRWKDEPTPAEHSVHLKDTEHILQTNERNFHHIFQKNKTFQPCSTFMDDHRFHSNGTI